MFRLREKTVRVLDHLIRWVGPRGKPVHAGHPKYFCIARNKTGTTSLMKAFMDLGFDVGDQPTAEVLYDRYYFKREFGPILDYCETAQVFQDVPFSCPYLFVALDQRFPGSKFILTVRDSSEQWYSSITRFHAKIWGSGGKPPTADELRAATYVRLGFAYNLVKLYGTTDAEPYERRTLIDHYERHNKAVLDYFKDRPDDLLVLNVAQKGSYSDFVKFTGVGSAQDEFPWENAT